MLRYLADENFNQRIVRGLLRRLPEIDIAIAQDVGLGGVPDSDVLAWAADENRVLLTHDVTRSFPRPMLAWQRATRCRAWSHPPPMRPSSGRAPP